MTLKHFIGREQELNSLNELLNRHAASLAVIKGRRRVGKSRLAAEFAKDKTFYPFAGLPPIDGTTAQDQRDEFTRQLCDQTDLPRAKYNDWGDLFSLLASKVKKGRIVILLDEITWLAHGDPNFLGKLKNVWEKQLQKNDKLILILCGSISAWIEKHILGSTGYFGRIHKKITLKELPLKDCNTLLDTIGFKRSAYEKFLYLSLTGGIPWYIELIQKDRSAADNINALCFHSDAPFIKEHDYIFHDLFGRKSEIYSKITASLAKGPKEYKALAKDIGYSSSGTLTDYLNALIISGYITRDFSWDFKQGTSSAISTYRLSDNYLRFYYKYIQPKIDFIESGRYNQTDIFTLPGWISMMGLQFENLVLNNRDLIIDLLNINHNEIIADNPYLQRATQRHAGCQVDYLIQTKLNTIFVIEIKFSKNEIKKSIIHEMQDKIKRLVIPKNATCIPILIHVNGVSDEVIDSGYFYRVIDFSEFLKKV